MNIATLPPWAILGFGVVAGWLKTFWQFIYDHSVGWFLTKLRVEMRIEEATHAEAFAWVNVWIERQLRAKRVSTLRIQPTPICEEDEEKLSSTSNRGISMVPDYGTYYLWRGNLPLVFSSGKEDSPKSTGAMRFPIFRSATLTLWGTRNRQLLLDLLEEAKLEFETTNPRQMRYYTHGDSGWWESNTLTARQMDTVYLPNDQMQDIMSDFNSFFASEHKYRSLGIPWRHGYLFEGPPGGGKSTLVQALSTHFKVPIYYLNLSVNLTSSDLLRLIRNVRSPSILLIEDADCIGAARTRVVEGRKDRTSSDEDEPSQERRISELQTNDLLNSIDGLVASEQRILIMTTNHPEALDKALLREGRIDRRWVIDYAKDEEIRRFYDKAKEFYPLPDWEAFRSALPEKCTLANAQGAVFRHNNPSYANLK